MGNKNAILALLSSLGVGAAGQASWSPNDITETADGQFEVVINVSSSAGQSAASFVGALQGAAALNNQALAGVGVTGVQSAAGAVLPVNTVVVPNGGGSSDDDGFPIWAIVVIAACGAILLALIIGCCCCKKKNQVGSA